MQGFVGPAGDVASFETQLGRSHPEPFDRPQAKGSDGARRSFVSKHLKPELAYRHVDILHVNRPELVVGLVDGRLRRGG
jgi:hypothetical protein